MPLQVLGQGQNANVIFFFAQIQHFKAALS
jgi:hypothetical protein